MMEHATAFDSDHAGSKPGSIAFYRSSRMHCNRSPEVDIDFQGIQPLLHWYNLFNSHPKYTLFNVDFIYR